MKFGLKNYNNYEKKYKSGKLFKFRKDYVVVISKFRDAKIDRVAAYCVLLANNSIDVIPVSLLKEIKNIST